MTLAPRIRNLYLLPAAATTLGCKNTVFIRSKYQGRQREELLAHETIHLHQARTMGSWTLRWRWLFRPKWRVALEAQAYADDVRHGRSSVESCARALSSGTYLWPCDYQDARLSIEWFLRESICPHQGCK